MNGRNLVSTPLCLLFILLTTLVGMTVATAFVSVAAHADSIVLTHPNSGHSYQRIDTAMTWQDAKSHCEGFMAHEGIAAHLATLSTGQESQFVFDNLVADQGPWDWVWLGGTDETVEGTWEWVTGEPWSYEPWEPGEPNNACTGEDYLAMRPDGAAECIDTNSDASCGNGGGGLRFICEWAQAATPADDFEMLKSTISGGGGTSSDGEFSLTGTIGQPGANRQISSGDGFLLAGGFWAKAHDVIFRNSFEGD